VDNLLLNCLDALEIELLSSSSRTLTLIFVFYEHQGSIVIILHFLILLLICFLLLLHRLLLRPLLLPLSKGLLLDLLLDGFLIFDSISLTHFPNLARLFLFELGLVRVAVLRELIILEAAVNCVLMGFAFVASWGPFFLRVNCVIVFGSFLVGFRCTMVLPYNCVPVKIFNSLFLFV
jgi:hypothetical protein